MESSRSIELLTELVAYPSVSLSPNIALIHHVEGLLAANGIASSIVTDESGTRANLFASVGPDDVPGIVLAGHTDVVPVEGQPWRTDPFKAQVIDGRIHGRGTADMKGFVACAVNALIDASHKTLVRPLQLALSYDEEIGCVGVRRLLALLEQSLIPPMLCVVGEPTMMQIGTGHKGKAAYRAICRGEEGHSALAPKFANAIHAASDLIQAIRTTQAALADGGIRDEDYDVPYSTLHVGRIAGGKALNIVPNECTLDFEIRSVVGDDADAILGSVKQYMAQCAAPASRMPAPEIEQVNAYPGLDTHPTSAAVRFIERVLPANTGKTKVAFGTEGGLFQQHLKTPVVICGPGSIDVAHKRDEYVDVAQMHACDTFLGSIVASICR